MVVAGLLCGLLGLLCPKPNVEVTQLDSYQLCSLAPEPGPCKALSLRFFYDPESETCKKFIYGGCRGNENNFMTVDDCIEQCGSICLRAPDPGPCRGYVLRFFYDPESKECKQFIYGGCVGNDNNFRTRNACITQCGHIQGKQGGGGEEEPEVSGHIQDNTGGGGEEKEPAVAGNIQDIPGGGGEEEEEPAVSVHIQDRPGGGGEEEEPEVPVHIQDRPGGGGEEEEPEVPGHIQGEPVGDDEEEEPAVAVHIQDIPGGGGEEEEEEPAVSDKDRIQDRPGGGGEEEAPAVSGHIQDQPGGGGEEKPPAVSVHIQDQQGGGGEEEETAVADHIQDKPGGGGDEEKPAVSGGEEEEGEEVDECDEEGEEPDPICSLDPDVGPCKASLTRYYFNYDLLTCQTFTFGGCKGNANNFETLEDCHFECA